jgi:hypothetical protein
MPTLRNAVTEARQRGQAAHEGLKEVAHRASESHHFAIQDGATDGDIHRAIEDVEKLHTEILNCYQLLEHPDIQDTPVSLDIFTTVQWAERLFNGLCVGPLDYMVILKINPITGHRDEESPMPGSDVSASTSMHIPATLAPLYDDAVPPIVPSAAVVT